MSGAFIGTLGAASEAVAVSFAWDNTNEVLFLSTLGGATIYVYGDGFTGATGITIGGTAGAAFAVLDDGVISFTSPAHAAGVVDVVVQHPGGNVALVAALAYVLGASLAASTLSVTSGSFAGGTLVTVTGALRVYYGATITLGGVAHPLTILSDTSFSFITKLIAEGSVGAKDLVIADLFGRTDTKVGAFAYNSTSKIPSFTDGSDMDAAAVAGAVGDLYRLVGATTGAVIALLEVVNTTGPIYQIKGRARWYQATGTEFDGVFKWARLGTAGAITWGATPGSRTNGGLKHGGTGTIELQGVELQSSTISNHSAEVYIAAWDTAPATNRCLLFGWTRPGVDTLIYAAGAGYSTVNLRAGCSAGGAGGRDAPTLTVAAVNITQTAAVEWSILCARYVNAGPTSSVFGTLNRPATSTTPVSANGTSVANNIDSRPSITKVGDANAFILETHFDSMGAT